MRILLRLCRSISMAMEFEFREATIDFYISHLSMNIKYPTARPCVSFSPGKPHRKGKCNPSPLFGTYVRENRVLAHVAIICRKNPKAAIHGISRNSAFNVSTNTLLLLLLLHLGDLPSLPFKCTKNPDTNTVLEIKHHLTKTESHDFFCGTLTPLVSLSSAPCEPRLWRPSPIDPRLFFEFHGLGLFVFVL